MDESSVLISVVIPTYNYEATLQRAISSVVSQLDDTIELLVVDDGSTDGTRRLVTRIQQEIPNSVHFISKANGGAASARNVGIGVARGRYLVFLDADDELCPDALEQLGSHIAQYPDTRMVVGGHVSVASDGKRRERLPGTLPSSALERVRAYLIEKKIVLCNGACAMHRDVFLRGKYPEAFRSAEDIPVFAQALANYPCSVLRAPLALIHKHDDSLRHQFCHAKAGGLGLVSEVFSSGRLGQEFKSLEAPFLGQRCLSLFRSAYLERDYESALGYFRTAIKNDWRVLGKLSYSRKALRLWLRS